MTLMNRTGHEGDAVPADFITQVLATEAKEHTLVAEACVHLEGRSSTWHLVNSHWQCQCQNGKHFLSWREHSGDEVLRWSVAGPVQHDIDESDWRRPVPAMAGYHQRNVRQGQCTLQRRDYLSTISHRMRRPPQSSIAKRV